MTENVNEIGDKVQFPIDLDIVLQVSNGNGVFGEAVLPATETLEDTLTVEPGKFYETSYNYLVTFE